MAHCFLIILHDVHLVWSGNLSTFLSSIVLDSKLLITDPDPRKENKEFWIRMWILDPDPFVN